MAPPPPICMPFNLGRSKGGRRLSWSSSGTRNPHEMIRQPSHSPTATLKDDTDGLTFHTDTEQYDDIPDTLFVKNATGDNPKATRSNAMTGTKKSLMSTKWGYGWGGGRKQKEVEAELEEEPPSMTPLPTYRPPTSPPTRSNTMSSQGSKATYKSQDTHRSQDTQKSQDTYKSLGSQKTNLSHQLQGSQATKDLKRNNSQQSYASASTQKTAASGSSPKPPRPQHRHSNESTSTLIGSALERKINEVDSIKDEGDTHEKLSDLRRNMVSQTLNY